MYKTVCVIAVLILATLAFTFGSTSPNGLTTPQIVASGKMLNQTTAFSKTLYTPGESGVYRLSAYATLTTAQSVTSNTWWYYSVLWTDASGTTAGAYEMLYTTGDQYVGPFLTSANTTGGTSVTFQANKGMPITQQTTLEGTPDGSAYSVYYTLERLE